MRVAALEVVRGAELGVRSQRRSTECLTLRPHFAFTRAGAAQRRASAATQPAEIAGVGWGQAVNREWGLGSGRES